MRGGQSLLVCFMLWKFQVQHALSRSATTVCCYSAHQTQWRVFRNYKFKLQTEIFKFPIRQKTEFLCIVDMRRFGPRITV